MTNKTITLSREVGEMILRNRDRLGSGIIDPIRAALAEPVPPAGGEPEDPNSAWEDTFGPHYEDDSETVEVVAIISTEPKEHGHYFTPDELRRFNRTYKSTPARGYTVELVDRAHVNRLQAENADYKAGQERYEELCEQQRNQIRTLQSELTKARECLKATRITLGSEFWDKWAALKEARDNIGTVLSNQSEPADKP